jgi:hypothetical protein
MTVSFCTVYTPFDTKLQTAAVAFPDNLKVEGINPLQVLFQEGQQGAPRS